MEDNEVDASSDDEQEDVVSGLCTCGQSARDGEFRSSNQGRNGKSMAQTWLESSFVHLLAPRKTRSIENSGFVHPQSQQHGFLESHQHLTQMMSMALANQDNPDDTSQIPICTECIDRVAHALDANAEQLIGEIQSYSDAISAEKQRKKTFEALSPNMDVAHMGQAYENEIEMLKLEIKAQESEMEHLKFLYEEQIASASQLDALDEQIQHEEADLQLQTKALNSAIHLQASQIFEAQHEVDCLSIFQLPKSLFDLQVDQRGLRYPLINNLRMAFRPKGDVPSKEIQVAWSQATQLLLSLGTLLQFRSRDWKLVPLSDCAKLIFKKNIYNIKPGDCRGLLAWNALLDQIIKHAVNVTSVSARAAPSSSSSSTNSLDPPFQSSSTSIDRISLTQLAQNDHSSWSQVIHRIASNLLWLMNRTSRHMAAQVCATTHSVV